MLWHNVRLLQRYLVHFNYQIELFKTCVNLLDFCKRICYYVCALRERHRFPTTITTRNKTLGKLHIVLYWRKLL